MAALLCSFTTSTSTTPIHLRISDVSDGLCELCGVNKLISSSSSSPPSSLPSSLSLIPSSSSQCLYYKETKKVMTKVLKEGVSEQVSVILKTCLVTPTNSNLLNPLNSNLPKTNQSNIQTINTSLPNTQTTTTSSSSHNNIQQPRPKKTPKRRRI